MVIMHTSFISSTNLANSSKMPIKISQKEHSVPKSLFSSKNVTNCPNCGIVLTSLQQTYQQENTLVCLFCQKKYTKIPIEDVYAF